MKAHLAYARYIISHKWFVLCAGLKTRAPLWRLVIHDWSKLTPAEWNPYVRTFYGRKSGEGTEQTTKALFDAAWLHHQHRNPHHWQHWTLVRDDGSTKILEMPEHFVREMVADWMGAGRAITGRWDAQGWYRRNYAKMLLAPRTRQRVEQLLSEHASS